MDQHWVEFSKVAVAHLLAVASPGPDFALVLKQSLSRGRRIALCTSLGIGAAILVHVSYSLLGLGLLIRRSETWFLAVKYAGAAYIAWLGFQSLRAQPRTGTMEPATPRDAGSSGARAFVSGFLTNVLNPKATLFFISLFALVVSPETPKWIQAGYGVWMATATAAWFCAVSLVFTRPEIRAAFWRGGHWIDRALGVVFLVFAASLAFANVGD
jgi:RhtB (resistance to homoserine/threonine) family protein